MYLNGKVFKVKDSDERREEIDVVFNAYKCMNVYMHKYTFVHMYLYMYTSYTLLSGG